MTARDEREFLPAALEVLETPASPIARAMALAIGAFFVVAVVWSVFGKVDIIATAPGRILPVGEVKVIQPLDAGVVTSIQVRDGDHVRAGQVLIVLDPTQTRADEARLTHDLALALLDDARLTALKRSADTGGSPSALVVPPGSDPDHVEQTRAALRSQVETEGAKIRALDGQIAEKRAEEREVDATIAKLNASIPILEQKERLHRDLHDQGYGTTFSYLDAQQALSEARSDLKVDAERGAQARAAQLELEGQRAQAVAEYAGQILTDLNKAEEKDNELTQELIKARQKTTQTELRAPIDGVVEQLAVHTLGGVVTPAERLLMIVPQAGGLTVEAQLANRDIGFVRPGQDVSIKVETFAFTRYGLVHGKVIDVSRDSVGPREPGPGDAPDQPHSDDRSDTPRTQSPTYVARIALDRSNMLIDGHVKSLIPGMAVTAEIKTGRRTIMDYLLSPLARETQEALHER